MKASFLVSVFLLLLTITTTSTSLADAAYCHGKPDPNAQPNLNPISDLHPAFVEQVPNGKLYMVENGDDTIPIVHLYGTAYEMGYAQGQLRGDALRSFYKEAYKYFEESAAQAITGDVPWFPQELAELVALWGLDTVLDLEIEATLNYTGEYFMDEMHGLADAIKMKNGFKMIQRLLLMGELTKGDCSMFGAWGDATADGIGLLQLRALDWDMAGPFRDFPQITVYHGQVNESDVSPPHHNNNVKDRKRSMNFVNIGYTGFIGSLNGVNEKRISTSEIGVAYPDDTFGNESRYGVPFTYLLRDILQFDTTLEEALDRITNSHRTCDLILGVGDGKEGAAGSNLKPFRGIEYSASVANFYDDTNMEPYNETWHPRMDSMVYYGMDWNCPNFDVVLHEQLALAAGELTGPLAIRNVTAIEQSGTSLITYYSYTDNSPSSDDLIYVSFAAAHDAPGPVNAYDRPFVKLNLDALFNEPEPQWKETEDGQRIPIV